MNFIDWWMERHQ